MRLQLKNMRLQFKNSGARRRVIGVLLASPVWLVVLTLIALSQTNVGFDVSMITCWGWALPFVAVLYIMRRRGQYWFDKPSTEPPKRGNFYEELGFVLLGGALFVGTLLLSIPIDEQRCSTVEAGKNLSGCVLDDLDAEGQDLRGADLSGTWLKRANLRGTDLSGVNLSTARLGHADLTNANLSHADLTNADLQFANVTGANFEAIDLSGTNLADTVGLTNAMISGAIEWNGIRLESDETFMDVLGPLCRGERPLEPGPAYDDASPNLHPLVLFNENGERSQWSNDLPDSWHPARTGLTDLVACVQDAEHITVENCEYTDGSKIRRMQWVIEVRLYDAQTGGVLLDERVRGPAPKTCPSAIPEGGSTTYDADEVSFDDVRDLLREYVNPDGIIVPPHAGDGGLGTGQRG